MRLTFGWIPFSVGDLLYTIIGILIIRWVYKSKSSIKNNVRAWFMNLLSTVAIAFMAFHILWAFNYYRKPLHKSLELDTEYTTEQLVSVTIELIEKTNQTHASLEPNDSLAVQIPFSKKEILKKTHLGYELLSEKYPDFEYNLTSIKPSLYSTPLTYMGFSGYLNPFTNEAQVDILIPKYQLPTTASHEVAHQLGYAAENEANFIAVLATLNHSDPYFNYSGYCFALRYCLNELYRRDPDNYKLLSQRVRPGIIKNFNETRLFWNSYENPFEPLFKKSYDNFLKANNQSKGIESYSYVVALLVSHFNKSI